MEGVRDPDRDTDQDDSWEYWLRHELKFSKSAYVPWGRKAIRALDLDDCVSLYEIYLNLGHLGASLSCQTTAYGYGGHIWTVWIHKHLGDTILHLAVKQRKMRCLYTLLFLDIDTSIRNSDGYTAEELSLSILKKTFKDLRLESNRMLLPFVDPRKFSRLPDRFNFRSLAEEAWRLMEAGRSMFSQPPVSFGYKDIPKYPKPPPRLLQVPPRPKFRRRFDADTQTYYLINPETKEKLSLTEKEIVEGHWEEVLHEGKLFYVNELTGKYTEDRPKGFRAIKKQSKSTTESKEKVKETPKPVEDYSWTAKHKINTVERPVVKSLGYQEKIEEKTEYNYLDINEDDEDEQLMKELRVKMQRRAEEAEKQRLLKEQQRAQEEEEAARKKVEMEAEAERQRLLTEQQEKEKKAMDQEVDSLDSQQKNKKSRGKFKDKKSKEMRKLKRKKKKEEAELDAQRKKDSSAIVGIPSKSLEELAMEENQRQSNRLERRKYEQRQELLNGINISPGGQAVGDVWTKDNLFDVIRLLKRQQVHQQKVEKALSLKKMGLSLFSASTRARGGDISGGHHHQHHHGGGGAGGSSGEPISRGIWSLAEPLKGWKKLRFVKKEEIDDIIRFENLPEEEKEGIIDVKMGDSSQSQSQSQGNLDHGNHSLTLPKRKKVTKYDDDFVDFPYRYIEELSTYTNMKYLHVGNQGCSKLSQALRNDPHIKKLVLAHGRVSCRGLSTLSSTLPTMKCLMYLDVSQNGIGFSGVLSLVNHWNRCIKLESVVLGWNRLDNQAASLLVQSVLNDDCPIMYLNLVHNPLTMEHALKLRCDVISYNQEEIEERVTAFTDVDSDKDDASQTSLKSSKKQSKKANFSLMPGSLTLSSLLPKFGNRRKHVGMEAAAEPSGDSLSNTRDTEANDNGSNFTTIKKPAHKKKIVVL